ncbi:MAG: hypothetical protein ACYC2R_09225 [Burkholderiales bacterium]
MAEAGLNLDLLFGDSSPTGLTAFSSWLYSSEAWAWVLWIALAGGSIYLIFRVAYLAISQSRNASQKIGDEIPRQAVVLTVTIILIMPLLALGAVKWVGINSTQPLPTIQVVLLGAANAASKMADLAAQKLVSLHPFTAPSMPLLRAQADGYFAGAEQAARIAQANVEATGGALSGEDLNANLLHGAGVAYASAGLNNANTPPEKIQKMMQADLDAARRMQYLWSRRPNAAMTECVGNTMLSDAAVALNNSQFSTAPDSQAVTAATWNTYYQAAAAYLVGNGNAGGGAAPPANFGNAWTGGAAGSTVGTGSGILLPPVTDILHGAGSREIVLNNTAYQGAFAPGTDPQELQQSPVSVSSRLTGASDAQQRGNLQRLLVAVKAREAAQEADQKLRNQVTAAFETLQGGFALANVQGADESSDFSAVLKDAQGDGSATLNQIVQQRNLVSRCQAYGAQVSAVDLGLHLTDLGTRFNLLQDRLSDPTAAAKQVGAGGWLRLGVYFLATADSYKNAFDNANALREAAADSAGQYFSGDPVAIQATDANSAAMVAGTGTMAAGAGLMMKAEKLGKATANTIKEVGSKAASTGGEIAKFAGRRLLIVGWLIDMASIFRDFAPYLAFVVVAFWWYLRLAAFVLLAPAVVLVTAMRNFISLRLTLDDIADMAKRLAIFSAMPLVYVIGWAVIFFGTELLDVLIAAMSGKTGWIETLKNLATLHIEQSAMSSNLVPVIIKFFLGLAISTVLFKIEGWLESFLAGHGTKDADMNTPTAGDLAK